MEREEREDFGTRLEQRGYLGNYPPNLVQVGLMVKKNEHADRQRDGCLDGFNELIMRFFKNLHT